MSEVEKRRLHFNDQQWRAIANSRQTIEEALVNGRFPGQDSPFSVTDGQTQHQQEIQDLKNTVRELQSQLSQQHQKSHQNEFVVPAATRLSASHLLDLQPSLRIQPLGIRPWQAEVHKSLPDRPLRTATTPGAISRTMNTSCGVLSRAQVDLPRFARR